MQGSVFGLFSLYLILSFFFSFFLPISRFSPFYTFFIDAKDPAPALDNSDLSSALLPVQNSRSICMSVHRPVHRIYCIQQDVFHIRNPLSEAPPVYFLRKPLWLRTSDFSADSPGSCRDRQEYYHSYTHSFQKTLFFFIKAYYNKIYWKYFL